MPIIHISENLNGSCMPLPNTNVFTSFRSDLLSTLAISGCLLIIPQTQYKWWLFGEHF